MEPVIKGIILKKAFDILFDRIRRARANSKGKLQTPEPDLEEAIKHHLRSVAIWSREVDVCDLMKPKGTMDVFVELDLYMPRRALYPNEPLKTVPLKHLFDQNASHFILLGQPGAGKTTSMKYICQRLLLDESFYPDRFTFPILIRFRNITPAEAPSASIIFDEICNILGLHVDSPEASRPRDSADETRHIKERRVINILEDLKVLLILDGFDELPVAGKREEAIREIRTLAQQLDNSTMIVTSRTGDILYRIDHAVTYELRPLNKAQIIDFAKRWLDDQVKASDFVEKVYRSPFADTAIRPLTLAHLSAIYERGGDIPERPVIIYEQIVMLLLHEWDQLRGVKRYSRYADFTIDTRKQFLCELAYHLTTSLQKTVFSEGDLLKVYKDIYSHYEGLDLEEARQVISEIEAHNGLFLQSGIQKFEFAHKSLQEYLAAKHILKLPNYPSEENLLLKLPNELAIAVALSSNPGDYFSGLVQVWLLTPHLPEAFLRAFLNRLLLEKPAFSSTDQLAGAFILFFTLYVQAHLRSGQLSLFYSDKSIKEFEVIIRPALLSSVIEFIRRHYDIVNTHTMKDGDDILRMLKKEIVLERDDYPINVDRHPVIYIKKSFLTDLNP